MARGHEFTCGGVSYRTETCCRCQVPFAMDMATYKVAYARKEGMQFYCPNGHQQHYVSGETEAEKMRRERDRALQKIAQAEDEKREALEAAQKAERALARHKKRSAAGVCPCCSRTFANMARHMKTKHPQFAAIKAVA